MYIFFCQALYEWVSFTLQYGDNIVVINIIAMIGSITIDVISNANTTHTKYTAVTV